MNAGLLPLVDQGWLWPRTGFERWLRIGPMMPGEHPVEMLAQQLANAFGGEMADVHERLKKNEDGLRMWLRSRLQNRSAFLLAIDQFEELFTFADPAERSRFDRLLATALGDADCPLFVISTVRTDFMDRFDELPRLVGIRNRAARPWTLSPITVDGLREIISGPARLAGLDVSEVQEAMVAEARDEPGAILLVENALQWLWEQRTNNRLGGRLLIDQGGLAGIISQGADGLLLALGQQQDRALELLLRLVKVDPESRRHTRQRMHLVDAVAVAGGGAAGRALVDRLAGQRSRDGGKAKATLRLITVSGEDDTDTTARDDDQWVNLIHETLIRSKGPDAEGKPQPYWPTLWRYIEQHKNRAGWHERLQAETQTWVENQGSPSHLWSHERVREAVAALRQVGPAVVLTDEERAFLGPIDPDDMFAELERSSTSHWRRALIGERLDVLGDPRRGVGVDSKGTPKIEWCPVAGGEIAICDEKHTTKRVKGFYIARCSITVSQYRAFLEAEDGWQSPGWWAHDLYRDPDANICPVGHFGNYPAVYVSWFDAVAFCRWLSRRLESAVRLPDEWEWQQAATGGDVENVFLWGPDWDPKREPYRANTFESRLGGATAVGMYPAGASPPGALDMAGAVWEWCLNKYERPYETDPRADNFEPRVMRGGSWLRHLDFGRCAARFKYDPSFRYINIGFRVMRSSPIVDR
jgi:formylglycine-generating enzyme required for sulfatase activity